MATDDRWFVLLHTPGPSLPDGSSIFAHPAFTDHLAFLSGLHERGWLVAAGPTDPARGEGMTVVRIPAGTEVDIDALARTEDRCVAAGFLDVRIQPWLVALSGN